MEAYPWDPTLDPQIWRSATPHCGTGELRDDCWKRPGGKGKPPIPVSATIMDMEGSMGQAHGKSEVRPRYDDHGVRLLDGAQGYRLGDTGLLDAPIGSDSWDAGEGREQSGGRIDQHPYPIAHYKTPLHSLGDKTPFGKGNPPYGDHSEWPYASYQSHETWPKWAAKPGSNRNEKRIDAAVPDHYYDWGLGSHARVLNSGHTGGAPHDSAGDKDREIDIYNVPASGAASMTASTTSALRAAPAGATARGAGVKGAGGRDDDWEQWVDLALHNAR